MDCRPEPHHLLVGKFVHAFEARPEHQVQVNVHDRIFEHGNEEDRPQLLELVNDHLLARPADQLRILIARRFT